ncbi:MAG: hypothetical protein ACRD82_08320, partial [Blastocatellia bacterium]
KKAADALSRPLEDVIVSTLATTLPLLNDVPPEMAGELAAMAQLSDEALQGLANSLLPDARQELLDRLLTQQERGEMNDAGQRELAALMAECGRHVLRRAEAVAQLIARGRSAPILLPIPSES